MADLLPALSSDDDEKDQHDEDDDDDEQMDIVFGGFYVSLSCDVVCGGNCLEEQKPLLDHEPIN